jgi:hypothetical protein
LDHKISDRTSEFGWGGSHDCYTYTGK